jgi:ATP-dependent DNA helicase RecG
MDLIYELCIREAKALPDFLDSDDYIVRMRLEGSKLDEKLLALFRKIGDSAGSLSTEELMIITSLYHGKKVSPELRDFLPGLLETGIIAKKNNRYVLRKDLEELRTMGVLTEILSLIKQQQGITVDEMAEAISRNRRTVLRTVRALVEQGVIERVGPDKAGYWKVREDE